MSTGTLTKTIFLNTDRKTVWSYLTQKDKLALWFHPAQADLQQGEDYALMEQQEDGSSKKVCWGAVQKFEPPATMVWSFTIAPLNGQMTSVTWTLEECRNGTRLTMVHEGIEEAAGDSALALLSALDAGWDAHFGKLRSNINELQAA